MTIIIIAYTRVKLCLSVILEKTKNISSVKYFVNNSCLFILICISIHYISPHLHTSFHKEYKIWSHAAYIINSHYYLYKTFSSAQKCLMERNSNDLKIVPKQMTYFGTGVSFSKKRKVLARDALPTLATSARYTPVPLVLSR